LFIIYRLKAANPLTEFQKIPIGYSFTEYQKVSSIYLKAICRIYLIDFHCFNYTLPIDCESLKEELINSYEELHNQKVRRSLNDHFMKFLRSIIPFSVFQSFAYLICFTENSPDCYAKIAHGEDTDTVEIHDEL
jgi:hypothetical protein